MEHADRADLALQMARVIISVLCCILQIVSPLNHMVFTPLLASACVGTLGLRSVAVPITALQKRLTEPQNKYIMASAQNVDPDKKIVECKDEDGLEFSVAYDKLVVATGSQVITDSTRISR